MLVIRMQRVGRKGHAQFRVVVQDSRRTPTSGKIVAQVGTYDPHSKNTNLNKERTEHYLSHGAQPSPRVARLLKAEGIKLPKWVEKPAKRQSSVKNPEKLRRNRPAEPVAEASSKAEPVANVEVNETTEVPVPTEAPTEPLEPTDAPVAESVEETAKTETAEENSTGDEPAKSE
jgi:small subunit ribosomal protein S16